jgi:hypothetical protein
MAVIREKQQFQNQRIGVVRMDTGAENYYQTVANAADTLTQIAFKEAGRVAQKKGTELAESASTQSLRTINPETGKPEAYNIPENFGTAAQAAYEEVLDRRFISDVDNQIKERARELVLKYQNDPQGVEKYGQAMEDYVAQMINPKNSGALNDRFQNIIRDTGAAFIASTKFNLMTKRAEVVQNQLRDGLIQDAINGGEAIEDLIKSGKGADLDYESGDATSNLDLMIQTELDRQDAGLDAGILTQPQYEANVTALMSAVPTGILNNRLNYDAVYVDSNGKEQRMTSDVALEVENAIDTGVISKDLPDSLVSEVNTILESDGYKRNKSGIQRKAGELRVALSNREKEVKDLTAQQESDIRVYRGDKADPQDIKTKRSVDNLVVQRNKDLSSQPFPNLIEYYLSQESLEDDTMYVLAERQNIFGEQFLTALNMGARANTGWTAENYIVALKHFETFTNVNILGSPTNKLNQHLSNNDMAFYRALSSLTKNVGTQNILQNVAQLNAVYDDPAGLDDRLKTIFETDKPKAALKDFLNDAFPADRRMQEMARPLVELMAYTGSNMDQIKKQLLGMYENQYVKTNGVVIDMNNPELDRSIYAPHAFLGSKDVKSFYINGTEYINSITDGGYVLSENPVGIDQSKVVRLYPTTANAGQPDLIQYEYTVQDGEKELKRTGQLPTYQYMAVTVQENGTIIPILDNRTGVPIYFGTELAQKEIMLQMQKTKQAEIDEENRKVARQLEANVELEKAIEVGGP